MNLCRETCAGPVSAVVYLGQTPVKTAFPIERQRGVDPYSPIDALRDELTQFGTSSYVLEHFTLIHSDFVEASTRDAGALQGLLDLLIKDDG